ncbi:hypothetical protein NDU88_000714 [Pleurodeles waltl]|uniref:Uncharacterized protein n=1 Tax=Pleurodeles waltl TaxID=8319 RepID=A0AAV7UR98_PLEWA|nr:hypothetical protein NDU88_000714 [Pleurodeles waltl]
MRRNRQIPAALPLCDPVPRSVPGCWRKKQARRSTLGAQFTQRHRAIKLTLSEKELRASGKKPQTAQPLE